jgi:polysaccharide chain length determinant protein (PEP-CTERM system associated)
MSALRRRLWHVVVPVFVIAMAVVLYCIKAPKTYRSTALILIQPQEVPADYVKPTVTSDVQARLNAITEQIMSRSRLEQVIQEHDLYPDIRAAGGLYTAVERIRESIDIVFKESENSQGKAQAPTAFEISFEGKDPTSTRDVTRAVANLFIDHNFKLRAEQAAGTTQFLDRELARIKDELRQKEEAVRRFKEDHLGFLPEQMQNNYSILTQLQQHLDSLNSSLQKTEDRKVLLQTQLSKLETFRADSLQVGHGSTKPLSLEELRHQLQTLQAHYSDRHPEVIRIQALIAGLEKQLSETTTPKSDSEESAVLPPTSETQRLMRLQKDDLLTELKLIDAEIRSLRDEQQKTREQIEAYKHRIENGPRIEQMFVDLRRDYERANDNYQSLLQKKLEAELAENLERTQKGEQFIILDQANLPDKPFKPDIPMILFKGFLLALTCGFALAFIREFFDQTFRTSEDLESIAELPVLVSIPLINTVSERRWGMFRKSVTVCLLAVMSSSLLYALFVLWKKNPSLLPFSTG